MKKSLLLVAITALLVSIASLVITMQKDDAPASSPTETNLAKTASFSDGQKAAIHQLISDYIAENPDAIIDSLQAARMKEMEAQRKKAQKDIKKMKPELHGDNDSPFLGNPKGDITIVEFFDYNCGYCKSVFPSLLKLTEKDKGVKIIFRDKPSLGKPSFFAAKAALAAHKQGKYFEMHKALMESKGRINEAKVMKIAQDLKLNTNKLSKDLDAKEVNEMISKNQKLARKLGLRGVPAILIEDQYYPGAMPLEKMQEQIKEIRAKRK